MKQQLKNITLSVLVFIVIGLNSVNAQCSEFYGVTYAGGEYGVGTIFKTDGNGNNLTNVFSLYMDQGLYPTGDLCKAPGGKVYGLTPRGGINGGGILFEWDAMTDSFEIKFQFDTIENGSSPFGSLVLTDNGKLYGMTAYGGENNLGVLFEWDPALNTYTKKLDFNGLGNGSNPQGSLLQADNGKLYGMTAYGGESDNGVLFEWDPTTNTYTKKLDFNGEGNGGIPWGSLMQADDGKIYGMTTFGGVSGDGTLFEWDPAADSLTKKLDFNYNESGRNPYGSLVQADNGRLYGMTYSGARVPNENSSFGELFEWNPVTNTYMKKFKFDKPENGTYPKGSLMKAANGKLYGMTSSGGEYYVGVLFEWDPVQDTFTKKTDFKNIEKGEGPNGSLVQLDNGKLYGMTNKGGTNNAGVIFEYDPVTSDFAKKFTFIKAENGSEPFGSLVQADNGKLYGMTLSGGEINRGVLFEWDPVAEIYTKKFDFTDGYWPYCSLMKADNGKLYGMTTYSKSGGGILFEWDPVTDTYTKKLDNMGGPQGTLIEADNGKFYGLTYFGSTLFEWDPTTNIRTNYDHGTHARGTLVQADNGKLYGMTQEGGVNNKGVLFEWDPVTETYIIKLDFNGEENGSYPISAIMKASNGKLYGMTALGGINDAGVIFEWDPDSDTYTKKFDFNFIDGYYPLGSMMQADNGKLYGVTQYGGLMGAGVFFEFDPANGTFTKKFDLNVRTVGGNPWRGSLIEIKHHPSSTINVVGCDRYTSPSGHYTWKNSGVYIDTISSSAGCDSIITLQLIIKTVDASVTQDQETLTASAIDASYQWIDCNHGNIPLEGEMHQVFTASQPGNYAVIVSENGCTDTSAIFSVNITGLIMNTFKQNIVLYPNPNDGSFFIDMGKVYPNTQVTIIGSDGQIIQKETNSNARVINLKMFAQPGTYIVTITSENKKAVFKMLKN
jgi:uncharacterized repeat protein (TIGR03803 family)